MYSVLSLENISTVAFPKYVIFVIFSATLSIAHLITLKNGSSSGLGTFELNEQNDKCLLEFLVGEMKLNSRLVFVPAFHKNRECRGILDIKNKQSNAKLI